MSTRSLMQFTVSLSLVAEVFYEKIKDIFCKVGLLYTSEERQQTKGMERIAVTILVGFSVFNLPITSHGVKAINIVM